MRTVLILSLALALGHSAPVDTNVDSSKSEEERDSKQLLTLAEFRKKVGQVIGEELTKVINGAFTIPPIATEAAPVTEAARVTEAAPVTEEQTIIVYITEPPPAPEESIPQTSASERVPNAASQSASEAQPAPSSPPATSAPVETISEVAATELVQEASTAEDEDEEETEAPESTTTDPEVVSANAVAEESVSNIPVETNEATSNVEVEEGSTPTLPPAPIVGKVVETTEDDERDGAFTFPPVATVSGSVVEEAFENSQSTEPVPIGSSTLSASGTPVDEDDDDEEDEDEYELEYEEVEDGDNRTAKKKIIKKVSIKKVPLKNAPIKKVPLNNVPIKKVPLNNVPIKELP